MAKPVKIVVLGDASDAKKAFREIREEAEKTEGPLSEFGEKLGGFATAAAGVALGVGVAAAGLFAKGFADGMNTEAATDKLRAQLNLTAGAAETAGDVAKDVFRGAWGDSIEEVSQAISDLHKFDLVDLEKASEDTTRSLAEDALTIADVWDQEVNEVIRAAGALLDADLVDSAEEAFDIITSGFTEGADVNGDFLDTLFEYSGAFGDAGLSADQFIAGLIAGTDAGMMGVDKVGDAVKELGIRVQEESPDIHKALEDIGLDADEIQAAFAEGGAAAGQASEDIITALANTEDPLEQHRAAVALLGTPYEDLNETGPEVLRALADGNLEVRDTADVASDAYNNTATKIEEFKRRGLGALEDFVAGFLSGLGMGGESGSINEGIDSLNTWIAENEDTIIQWGEEFAGTVLDIVEAFQQFREDVQPVWDWFVQQNEKGMEAGQELIDLWNGFSDWWTNVFMPVLADMEEVFIAVGEAGGRAIAGPINAVIDAWNNLSIPGFTIDLPGLAPWTWAGWESPNIPRLHTGGVFRAPVPGGEGLALLRDGERVLRVNEDTEPAHIVLEFSGNVYGMDDFDRRVQEMLVRARRRGVAV